MRTRTRSDAFFVSGVLCGSEVIASGDRGRRRAFDRASASTEAGSSLATPASIAAASLGAAPDRGAKALRAARPPRNAHRGLVHQPAFQARCREQSAIRAARGSMAGLPPGLALGKAMLPRPRPAQLRRPKPSVGFWSSYSEGDDSMAPARLSHSEQNGFALTGETELAPGAFARRARRLGHSRPVRIAFDAVLAAQRRSPPPRNVPWLGHPASEARPCNRHVHRAEEGAAPTPSGLTVGCSAQPRFSGATKRQQRDSLSQVPEQDGANSSSSAAETNSSLHQNDARE